jgi:hypothetical protein
VLKVIVDQGLQLNQVLVLAFLLDVLEQNTNQSLATVVKLTTKFT